MPSPDDYLRELVKFFVMADHIVYQRNLVRVSQISPWLPLEKSSVQALVNPVRLVLSILGDARPDQFAASCVARRHVGTKANSY